MVRTVHEKLDNNNDDNKLFSIDGYGAARTANEVFINMVENNEKLKEDKCK